MIRKSEKICGELGPLYPHKDIGITMYSYNEPANAFWRGVVDGALRNGISEEDIIFFLQSKHCRWAFDGGWYDLVKDLGYNLGKKIKKEETSSGTDFECGVVSTTIKCMMTIVDFEYLSHSHTNTQSKCKLKIYAKTKTGELPQWLVIATELPDNSGPSITNTIESLASAISCFDGMGKNWVLIENYDDRYDHVMFKGEGFTNPKWTHIGTGARDMSEWFDLPVVW